MEEEARAQGTETKKKGLRKKEVPTWDPIKNGGTLAELECTVATRLLIGSAVQRPLLIDLSSDFSENLLFLSSRRILVLSFSISRHYFRFLGRTGFVYGSPYLRVRKRTELATNFSS